MARKRESRRMRACRVPGPDECLTTELVHDEAIEPDDDQFEQLIEKLYEKRAATRLGALNTLIRLLSSNVWQHECIAWESTLARLLLTSVRRGSDVEALYAVRALGLLVLTLGLEDGAERVWNEIRDPLIKAAGNKSKRAELRCAALESYAISCFVAEHDEVATQEAMLKMSSLWKAGAHSVQEAAIRGWALLLSPFSAALLGDTFEAVVGKLAALLEEPAVDVQRASGEAVALLYGLGLELDANEMYSSDDDSSVASNSTGLSRMSGLECAVDRMKDQAGPKGQTKKKSRKDRAAVRSTFRDVCSFVEDGIVQEERIKLTGSTLVIDNLPSLIQLKFVRKLLASGFQMHLNGNELLHQVFGYTPGCGPAPKLTKAEKRMLKSPQSVANRLRTKERKNGHAAKMEILAGCCV